MLSAFCLNLTQKKNIAGLLIFLFSNSRRKFNFFVFISKQQNLADGLMVWSKRKTCRKNTNGLTLLTPKNSNGGWVMGLGWVVLAYVIHLFYSLFRETFSTNRSKVIKTIAERFEYQLNLSSHTSCDSISCCLIGSTTFRNGRGCCLPFLFIVSLVDRPMEFCFASMENTSIVYLFISSVCLCLGVCMYRLLVGCFDVLINLLLNSSCWWCVLIISSRWSILTIWSFKLRRRN